MVSSQIKKRYQALSGFSRGRATVHGSACRKVAGRLPEGCGAKTYAGFRLACATRAPDIALKEKACEPKAILDILQRFRPITAEEPWQPE
jgi:hypothetical protein